MTEIICVQKGMAWRDLQKCDSELTYEVGNMGSKMPVHPGKEKILSWHTTEKGGGEMERRAFQTEEAAFTRVGNSTATQEIMSSVCL